MSINIRRLTIDDYDSIIRVWADAGLPFKPKGRDSREMISREMAHPDVVFLGLFESDLMLGVCIANFDGRRGWINRLAIDPDHRGIGLAGRLIDESEKFLKSRGALVIAGLIEEMNTPSMACFEKAGYKYMRNLTLWTKRESSDS
jgi:ribosomal protein S18 acetylase RimI-like enzyme